MSASRRGACGRFVLPRGDVGASPLSPAEAAVRAARGGSSSGPVCCPIAHQPTVLRESRSARRPSRSQLRNAGTSLCTRAGPLPRRPAPRRLTPRAGSSLYSFLASSTGSKTGPETGLGRENGRRRGQVREGAGPAVPRTRSDSGSAGPPCSPAQAEARAESPPARATPVAARGRCPLRAERLRPLVSPTPLSRLQGQLLHTGGSEELPCVCLRVRVRVRVHRSPGCVWTCHVQRRPKE